MTTTDTRAEARAALAAWDDGGRILPSKLAAALRALLDEHDALVREMHQRELHHFEVEKLLTEAGINPDEPVPTEDWEYELVDEAGRRWLLTPEAARDGIFPAETAMYRRRKPTEWEAVR